MLDPLTGGSCTTIRNSNPGNGCVDGGGFADTGDFSESFSDLPAQDDIDAYGGSLNLTWRLGDLALTSITGYEDNEIRRSEDPDGGALALAELYYSADTDQISQEVLSFRGTARRARLDRRRLLPARESGGG